MNAHDVRPGWVVYRCPECRKWWQMCRESLGQWLCDKCWVPLHTDGEPMSKPSAQGGPTMERDPNQPDQPQPQPEPEPEPEPEPAE